MQPDFNAPEVREVTAQADLLLEVGRSYKVATSPEYTVAGMELKRVKDAQKKLDELRKGMTRPLDAAKRAILDFFRAPEERLARAEQGIKRAMIAFDEEQERKRREEQRRANEAAQRERERLEREAAKAADKGKAERAQVLEERAAAVVAPVIQREAPKVAGIATREVWRFEVTDAAAVPREYLAVDEQKIRKVVGALKGDTTIPGVRVYSERAIAAASV